MIFYMNIAIDARSITWARGSGIGTYTSNIVNEIQKINTDYNYLLFWCDKDYRNVTSSKVKNMIVSKKHTRFFDNIYIPDSLKKNNIDLYHIPQNGIGLNEAMECRKIVTIHDLIPYVLPQTVGPGYLKNFLESMPRIIELCDGILTVSEYSKRDIIKFFPAFPKDKIYVTPLAANEKYKLLNRDDCKKKIQHMYSFDTDYILYIGGFSSRKNVKMIIDSLKESLSSLNSKVKLLIAGSLRDEGLNLKKYCSDINIDDNVLFIGYADDDLLPILYNGCTAFIYPSLYEGFGLPPLEAMSCGAPVITSNTTSIPEVVSDCGLLIDPTSQSQLSEAMVTLLNDIELQQQYQLLGLIRSRDFSWHTTALKTLDAYTEVLTVPENPD